MYENLNMLSFHVIFLTMDNDGEARWGWAQGDCDMPLELSPSVTSIHLITHLWEQMFSEVQDPLVISDFTVLVTGKAGKALYTRRDSTEEFLIFSLCLCVYVCVSVEYMCVSMCVYLQDLGSPKYQKKKFHFSFNKEHYELVYVTGAKSQNVIFVISAHSVSGICHKLVPLKSYLEKLSSQRNLGSPLPFPGSQGAILICDLLSP